MKRGFALLPALFALCAPVHADDHGLKLPAGFKATLYADHTLANDIYCMTLDHKGRVLVSSRGWVKRLDDTDGDGKADKATAIHETATGATGMYAGENFLYLSADAKFSRIPFRPDGTVSVKDAETLATLTCNEHGVHAMQKGPDGCIYLIAGNDAGLNKLKYDDASPINNPEGGGIIRFSKDMSKIECIAQGFRNPYDFDFTPAGDIITYDSDTERDFLLPWYSPTRMYHVAHGQHHGWRLPGSMRSLARPGYYADTVDVLAPIGRGSPTGVACYRHVQFPKRYHGGVFACDWTFGKIWFLPLEREGATYKTKPELFLEPTGTDGFAPTDICVAPDGAIYVSIGGRGTRGAVYRIEYTGTPEVPAGKYEAPKDSFEEMLTMPQPLDAWSRQRWEELANLHGRTKLHDVLREYKRPPAERVRALQILCDVFEGPTDDGVRFARVSLSEEVRAAVSWAVSRNPSRSLKRLPAELIVDPDEHVRAAALDSVADLLIAGDEVAHEPAFLSGIVKGLGLTDKRVRLAAMRCATIISRKHWREMNILIEEAGLRAQLSYALADHRQGVVPSLLLTAKLRTALDALKTDDASLRLDGLRLLMLVDGDWCLNNPPEEVSSAYALQRPRKELRGSENDIRDRLRQIYPTADALFNHEAARYFAMIEDDNRAVPAEIAARLTATSSGTDDIHHLIVLSRLKNKPAEADTAVVVNALLGLDKKLNGQQQRIKQNWGPRLSEIVLNLLLRYPKMIEQMLAHPNFVNPAHLPYTANFNTEAKLQTARLFLAAATNDANYAWSAELVDMLASLPAADCRPLFRKQWSDYSLRDAILSNLVEMPEAVDRQRFLDGLESNSRPGVLACIDALLALPRDPTAENLVPILRRLRASIPEDKDAKLRARLVALLNRQAEMKLEVKDVPLAPPETVLDRTQAYEPVFAWFEATYPAQAKLLRGDDDDADARKKTLATVKWEKGDAERGSKLFRERSCMVCHAGASRIGPDLTGAAGRFSREDLFAAIISPNRDVAPAYRVNDIETADGKNFSGIVVFESADGVIVQIDAVKTVRIDNANIASRQPGRKSLMPSGLLKDLKPDDMADLFAYLKVLK